MAKLTPSGRMPEFRYDTPFAKNLSMAETASTASGKTALVFLRYYGCTLCQLDLHSYKENYQRITAGGGQLLVVLQSDPDKLSQELTRDSFPFAIVCDPRKNLYRDFEIVPASSKLGLADLKTVKKIMKAKKSGFTHGEYEGEELQLPAAFVVDREMNLQQVHYGKSAADVPDADTLADWLR